MFFAKWIINVATTATTTLTEKQEFECKRYANMKNMEK